MYTFIVKHPNYSTPCSKDTEKLPNYCTSFCNCIVQHLIILYNREGESLTYNECSVEQRVPRSVVLNGMEGLDQTTEITGNKEGSVGVEVLDVFSL